MHQPGMEQEGLAFPEGVDHAMEEAHEEGGVEAHRSRGIQQHHQPQWLLLALPPGQIDRRAAMGHAAMDGAAEVQPPAAPSRPLAPHQPRAHGVGEALGQFMGARDFVGIGDVAQVLLRERFGGGSAGRPLVGVGGAVAGLVRLPLRRLRRRRTYSRPGPRSSACGLRPANLPSWERRAASASCRAPANRRRRSRRTSPSRHGWRRTAPSAPAAAIPPAPPSARPAASARPASPPARRQSRCHAGCARNPPGVVGVHRRSAPKVLRSVGLHFQAR